MAKRQSVNGSRARHENPIPNASRIGNIVMSSVIGGTNPGTRDLPPALEQQVANVFGYIRHDVEAAGGTRRRHHQDHVLGEGSGEAARGAERRVGEDVPRSGCASGAAHAAAARRQPRAGAGRLRRRDRLSRRMNDVPDATATMKFGVGQPIRRLEDLRLLTGKGRYQDDQTLHRQTWCVFVRSPHAHARIRSIDTAAASRAPGVVAVFTGTDYANDGIAMPKAAMPRKKRDGSPMFAPQRPALVVDRVRYVGDPVAMVIAETLAQAKDAAELVVVDYDPLPSVTSVAEAAEPDAPRVWDENADNISHTTERGNRAATEAAFAQAAHIVKRRYVITRVHAQYMEPRGAIGTFDPAEDRYTLYADVNYPHRVRNMLANMVFKVPESSVRVVCHDVGGGFGAKGWQYVEHRLTLWAARKIERPVKWRCERSEVILADEHGRDNVGTIELAFDARAKIIGLRLHMLASVGAYIASDRQLLTPFGQIGTVVGMYDIPAAYVTIDAVLSNTSPTAPYRGAGRPEASYLIERAMEAAAHELNIDPIELRRRNIIPDAKMPYKTALGPFYDCGEFSRNMEMALEASRSRRLRGTARGIACARHAAWPRLRQRDRTGCRPDTGIRGNPLQPERQRDPADGHQDARPGTRDRLQADPVRQARHRSARGAVHRRRHRSRRLRHGLERFALDGGRRIGADARRAEGDRQGQADHRASAGGGGGGHRIRRRPVQRRRHRSRHGAEGCGARGVPAGAAAARHGAWLLRTRHLCADAQHLPERLPCLRGGDRSRHRRGRAAILSGGR